MSNYRSKKVCIGSDVHFAMILALVRQTKMIQLHHIFVLFLRQGCMMIAYQDFENIVKYKYLDNMNIFGGEF